MYENHPSVLDRIKSTLIDSIMIIAGMYLISEGLKEFTHVPDWLRAGLFLLLFAYEPLCTAYGATIGNDKMKIRVRKNTDENKRINIFQALVRYFFKLTLGWVSFIAVFFNPKGRTIHDIICGSVMIKVKS